MPRRARLMLADVPVHVVQRGNNRQQCFHSDADRSFYLLHLARLLRPTGCVLHAYCLMTNHVHLLLTPLQQDSCARLMKYVAQLHAQYVNRLYKRSGTLWEGRYRSCMVQSESYLLACYRYIESNPVRAGMAKHPREYPWSSYQANAHGQPDALVTAHDEYRRLGRSDRERQIGYRELFSEGLSEARVLEIRNATNGNFALGSQIFQRQLAEMTGRRTERGIPGRPKKTAGSAAQLDLID